MKAENKVFVVTGGGSGMERELVLQLISKGARVAAVDINKTGLQETVSLARSTLYFVAFVFALCLVDVVSFWCLHPTYKNI